MRRELEDSKLTPSKAFNINRLNTINNFETGLSASLGFDYEIKNENKKIDISVGQVFNQNENKNMPTSMGLDENIRSCRYFKIQD